MNSNIYKIAFILIAGCMMATPLCLAQKENNMWTFGYRNGLNFNTSPPTLFESEVALAWEGCSSVSDENGNLLFYTDANVILDANGNIMPNGNGILGNTSSMFWGDGVWGSSSQGVAIARKPDNPNQYYVFVATSGEDRDYKEHNGKLRYTLVDMQLNGGAGDVVAGQKNILVDENISENVTLVQGKGCYYWLISHTLEKQFKVYKVDAAGIHPPANYPGHITGRAAGFIQVSPDKTKILFSSTVHTDVSNPYFFWELGDFDVATGSITNMQKIKDSISAVYSAAFSPNSQIVYTSTAIPTHILQYDISGFPDVTLIQHSRTILDDEGFGQLRTAPDGKIYFKAQQYSPVTGIETKGIGVIHHPNVLGTGCNIESSLFPTGSLAAIPDTLAPVSYMGLGNDAVVIQPDTLVFTHPDTLLCTSGGFILNAPEGYTTYKWNDGRTTATVTIQESGPYSVISSDGCNTRIDTFRITLLNTPSAISIKVSAGEFCYGETIRLNAVPPSAIDLLWSTGDTTASISVTQPGMYSVTTANRCGISKDSVEINWNCDCDIRIPNAFTPNGDGLNDYFKPLTDCDYTVSGILEIYNRWGQQVFVSVYSSGWDGTFRGLPCEAGVYYYRIVFTPIGQPPIERKGDITLIR